MNPGSGPFRVASFQIPPRYTRYRSSPATFENTQNWKLSESLRQNGSHKIFRNNAGIRVTVPDHSGKILHPKNVKQICRDTGISPEELG